MGELSTSPKKLCQFVRPRRSKSGKTQIWQVVSGGSGIDLGEISWHGAWRCYAFEPFSYTIWESKCLQLVVDFCALQTKKIRSEWAKKAARTKWNKRN